MSQIPGPLGAPRIPGAQSAAVPLEWVDLVGADAASFPTPSQDYGTTYTSVTEVDGLWTMTQDDAAVVNGMAEGIVHVFDMPTGWRDDGTQGLSLRVSGPVDPTVNGAAKPWGAVGVSAAGGAPGGAGAAPIGIGLEYDGAAWAGGEFAGSARTMLGGTADEVIGTWTPGGLNSAGDRIGAIAYRTLNAGTEVSSDAVQGTGSTGDWKIVVCHGSTTNGAVGDTDSGLRFQVALVELNPAP